MKERISDKSSENDGTPFLSRFNIGRRLAACFVSIILLMLVGNGLLIWQFLQLRTDADRLTAVDRELIAVLRFQTTLRSFYDRLNEVARMEDKSRLRSEIQSLRTSSAADAGRARELFRLAPVDQRLQALVSPTLDAVQSSLPFHLDAIEGLADAGDWAAIRERVVQQVQPLEMLSSELVKSVDQEVATERAAAAARIEGAQTRVLVIFSLTATCTLFLAATLGVAVTQSIATPLQHLMAGSRALARGDFKHRVEIVGKDELAELSAVSNETANTLDTLYANLRNTEEQVRESGKELQQLMELVPAHVFVLYPDGAGQYANRAVLDYIGSSLDRWIKEKLYVTNLHHEDADRIRDEMRKGFTAAQPFEAEARVLRNDGVYRWFLWRFNPLRDERGAILRWYVARTDIEDAKRQTERALNENLALREEVNRTSMFEEILGTSPKLVTVLLEVSRVASSDSTVLILGETGTGKELIARAIHKQSNRAGNAFIRVNCAAIPSGLVSSELFGHERGAFTGALQRRMGRFEAANGGTIFLDEIGELPLETQVSLLRVLQEREFERVGSNQSISVNVRILAATNRDLKAGIAAGTFRQDLFYRLNVFPIRLPALRERTGDIPLLVEYFVDRYAKKSGKRIRSIPKNTLELFESYDWPGNIRELQNVIERAVLLCDGDTLEIDAAWMKQETRATLPAVSVTLTGIDRLKENRERELIEAALAECSGRISGPNGAAAKLGIPRQTLDSMIARLGIKKYKYMNS